MTASSQPPSGAAAPKYLALRSGGALAFSILLHALLILALVRFVRQGAAPEAPVPAAIVWLGEIRTERPVPPPPERPPPPEPQARGAAAQAPPEPAGQSSAKPSAQSSATLAHRPKPRPAPDKAPPRPADAPRAHAATTRARPPTARSRRGARPPAKGPTVSELEALRRRAVEQVVAQQARDRGYHSFSLDDVTAKAAPADPNPWQGVWKAAFAGRLGGGSAEPSLMRAGQQRTKVGRAMAGLCQALLGGGDFFGLFSLCGSSDSGPDLDSPIRPAYLKKRPLCGPISPQQRAAALAAGADSTPGVKCRLVDEAERTAIAKRAGESGAH